MIRNILPCLLMVMASWAHAQVPSQVVQNLPENERGFFQLQKAFAEWGDTPEYLKEKGYKPYKRWEWFHQTRSDHEGNSTYAKYMWDAWKQRQTQASSPSARIEGNSWSPVGPDRLVASTQAYSGHGVGRINCIEFHPTDPNTYWIGASQGGVWKTTDNGLTWSPLSDNLPIIRINDIEVDPNNPEILYVSTGDYGYLTIDVLANNRNTNFGMGVFKTINGGQSWEATGLSFEQTDFNASNIRRVFVDHRNSQHLMAAGISGVWESNDAGNSWDVMFQPANTDFVWDIEQSPDNPDRFFLSTGHIYDGFSGVGNARVYRSGDFGGTWEALNNTNIPTRNAVQRIELAISPSDPQVVYAVTCGLSDGYYGTYRSDDGGDTWTSSLISSSGVNILGWNPISENEFSNPTGQGTYDLAVAVDPNDPMKLYVGGVNMWASGDGGSSWEVVSYWQFVWGNSVHADQHFAAFHPTTGDFYMCTDGGVYRTSQIIPVPTATVSDCVGRRGNPRAGCLTFPTSWEHLSTNVANNEFYRIGLSRANAGEVIAGAQDNGTYMNFSSGWQHVYGGDGMEAVIDHENPNTIFVTNPQGALSKSTDGGQTYNGTLQLDMWRDGEFGGWVTPFLMQYDDPNVLFAGFNNVWRSQNGGIGWSRISNFPISNYYSLPLPTVSLEVAESDPDVIYVGKQYLPGFDEDARLWMTRDNGSQWLEISSGLPVTSSTPNYFAVDRLDPLKVWVVFGGFMDGQKVFMSSDGGRRWENISKNLPNIPVNTIVLDKSSLNNIVYVGTDLGVYYTHDQLDEWVLYNDALPNVIINELEIHEETSILYAATYGRGVWMVPLLEDEEINGDIIIFNTGIYPNPNNGSFDLQLESSESGTAEYQIVNVIGQEIKSGSVEVRAGKSSEQFAFTDLPHAVHFFRLTLNGKTKVHRFIVE